MHFFCINKQLLNNILVKSGITKVDYQDIDVTKLQRFRILHKLNLLNKLSYCTQF